MQKFIFQFVTYEISLVPHGVDFFLLGVAARITQLRLDNSLALCVLLLP